MTPLSPPDLANTVTSFCTILAGAVTLVFCRWVGTQPRRWVVFYGTILLTGLPTFGWHGFGTEWLRVLDVGSNLLLGWTLQVAILGDFYPPAVQRRVATASGVVNVVAIAQLFGEGLRGGGREAVSFGAFGGFYVGELVLILNALLAVGLLYRNRARVPERAVPLLSLVTATFLFGFGLATAAGTTVHLGWLSYHALWHVVGAFGFVLLWAFNHVRFTETDDAAGSVRTAAA